MDKLVEIYRRKLRHKLTRSVFRINQRQCVAVDMLNKGSYLRCGVRLPTVDPRQKLSRPLQR